MKRILGSDRKKVAIDLRIQVLNKKLHSRLHAQMAINGTVFRVFLTNRQSAVQFTMSWEFYYILQFTNTSLQFDILHLQVLRRFLNEEYGPEKTTRETTKVLK